MTPVRKPPVLARVMMALLLPQDAREDIPGDLFELYQRRLATHGVWRARLWYWCEALSCSSRLTLERLVQVLRGSRAASSAPSSLDFKLGFRILRKYPGLTFVGSLAIAVAIAISTAFFDVVHDFINPAIPLPGGERIVGIQNWNQETSSPESRALHDFATWRAQLGSVQDLAAYTPLRRNLITRDALAEPVEVAAMTASAFRLVRVPPALGRPLLDRDEEPGAPPVVVIGWNLWRARFDGDSAIIGRTIQLGDATTTVVGVMPNGFAFPVRHDLWVPLRATTTDYEPVHGPSIQMFGRLAPGATMGKAQGELTAIGLRAAADFPATHRRLRPRVVPYARLFMPDMTNVLAVYGVNSMFLALLLIAGLNVATLTFARVVTREGEIAVRIALGASRARIVMQLFAEAFVLVVGASAIGLVVARFGVRWAMQLAWATGRTRPPFWWDLNLAPVSVLYAAAMALLCAAIVGIVPALKVTARGRLPVGLQQAANRGTSATFGGFWIAVIVAQVGLSVAVLPSALSAAREALRYRVGTGAIAANEYLSVRLGMDRPSLTSERLDSSRAAFERRFAQFQLEIRRRLESEPGVSAVTFASASPGMDNPGMWIEVDADTTADTPSDDQRTRMASVDVAFFDALKVPILAGRAFSDADLASQHRVVIVNQPFAQQFFGGRSPIGHRVREISRDGRAPGPWQEIVGVVRDLGMNPFEPADAAGIYRPAALGQMDPVHMIVRVGAAPELFAPKVREISAAVDPTVRLYDLLPLEQVGRPEQLGYRAVAGVLVLLGAIALLLSSAGIHALMSFIVARRTREIGIRVALGGQRRTVIAAVFRRALIQLSAGALIGGGIAAIGTADELTRDGPALFLMVLAVMVLTGLVACAVPLARALRIQPTEALRES